MPFIPPHFLDTPVFLYPSEDAAVERRGGGGGSGFLVGIECAAHRAFAHLYAVTNAHVCVGAPVLRIPRTGGSVLVEPGTFEDNWTEHPDGDDVAIRSLGAVPRLNFQYVDESALLTREHVVPRGIGPGDECLMIGRFVNRTGEVLDESVVRFGNLASLPVPVHQRERGFDQESFLVDMRSIGGFSGSQVIVYYPTHGKPTTDVPEDPLYIHNPREIMGNAWLLGAGWGHLWAAETVYDAQDNKIGQMHVNVGMSGVVPAWKIAEVLHMPCVVAAREEADAELERSGDWNTDLDTPNTRPGGLREG